MIFPLYPDVLGESSWMVLGTLLGIGFGLSLEGAGFGRAENLAAQFYGTDFRVLKVMFGAIVTAMVGMTVLSGIGWLDLSRVEVPPTFLWAQAVGGLLLGIGFIISGYCPGTAWVSTVSGHLDGLFTILGVLAGSLVFGMIYPWIEGLYVAGSMGVVRLPDLLGLPQAVVTAAVLAMAFGAFLFGEWVEKAMARRGNDSPPPADPRVRNRVFLGLGVAAVAGLGLMAVPPARTPVPAMPVAEAISPLDLATRLVEDPASMTVVDLRDPGTCRGARIPGALCAADDDPTWNALQNLPSNRTLVLYGDETPQALPDSLAGRPGPVLVLQGGYGAFAREILEEPRLSDSPGPEEIRLYRVRAALHGHFTGSQAAPTPVAVPRAVPATQPVVRKGGGC